MNAAGSITLGLPPILFVLQDESVDLNIFLSGIGNTNV